MSVDHTTCKHAVSCIFTAELSQNVSIFLLIIKLILSNFHAGSMFHLESMLNAIINGEIFIPPQLANEKVCITKLMTQIGPIVSEKTPP